MQTDMMPFEKLIRERTGLSVKKDALESFYSKIRERMVLKKARSIDNYFKIFKNNSDEFYYIVNFLTINETYFFREPSHITLFSQQLVPEILKRKSRGEPVRILSAGCSTGEEPYSLGIELSEKYGIGISRRQFSIIGADIDREAIEKAKQGIYFGRSFRSLSPYLKEKYFDPVGRQQYAVRKSVRDMVDFYFLNLMETPYPDSVKGADIIFYRNVSIYFDAEIQRKIFENLCSILNDNGYLVLGSTETLSHTFDVLPIIEMNGVFLYHKKKSDREVQPRYSFCDPVLYLPPPCPVLLKTEENKKKEHSESRKKQDCFDDALVWVRNKEYDKAVEILDRLIAADTDILRSYSLKAGIFINIGKTEEAKAICLKMIGKDPLCPEGYFLSGLIAKQEGLHEEAIRKFKETVYLNQSSWIAHFYLAQEYQIIGEHSPAIREYSIVLRLLEKGLFKDHGLVYALCSPFSFAEEDMMRLCRYNMEKIKRSGCGIR